MAMIVDAINPTKDFGSRDRPRGPRDTPFDAERDRRLFDPLFAWRRNAE